ncbi:MAG TPA: Cof-type HAD-IIB family hydrolase [Peptococcaceae bacterium]|nr:MAG: Cof-like hydrolase [Clostridia bacterium 41_269]HBT20828.1 Cof-type HAD-IIB family hydrolase [Peptococcaceae bacterium]
MKRNLKIKLVAVDLDGTLLDNDGKISPRVKEAVRKVREKGVEVTLATGRTFLSAKPFAEELGLNLPLITYMGALVKYSDSQRTLYERRVPSGLAQEVIKATRKRGYPINFYVDDCVLVEELAPQNIEYARKYNVVVKEIGDLSNVSNISPIKLLIINENEEEMNKFEKECRELFGKYLHITKSMPEFLEFSHPEATKARGLEAVAEHLGLKKDEIMAIGDSYNDLEMLEYAGLAVVMGNAREDIKRYADYITATNEDDGVAEALEKFILKKEAGI